MKWFKLYKSLVFFKVFFVSKNVQHQCFILTGFLSGAQTKRHSNSLIFFFFFFLKKKKIKKNLKKNFLIKKKKKKKKNTNFFFLMVFFSVFKQNCF